MRSLIRAFQSLKNSLTFKLLTEHHLEFLSLKGAVQARLSLWMSKCHIVGNLTSWLIYMGVKKNRLIENPQHMIWLRMSKLIFIYTLLSRGLRQGKGITINCCKKWVSETTNTYFGPTEQNPLAKPDLISSTPFPLRSTQLYFYSFCKFQAPSTRWTKHGKGESAVSMFV